MKYYEDKSDRKMELKLLPLSEDDKLIRECMEQASAFYGCLGKMGVTEILCDRKKAQELDRKSTRLNSSHSTSSRMPSSA